MNIELANLLNKIKDKLEIKDEIVSIFSKYESNIAVIRGRQDIVKNFSSMVGEVKSIVTIASPEGIPEVLQNISEKAYGRKAARFSYTSKWDLSVYAPILNKMLSLGNVQFRVSEQPLDIYFCVRDYEQMLLGNASSDPNEEFAVIFKEEILELFHLIEALIKARTKPYFSSQRQALRHEKTEEKAELKKSRKQEKQKIKEQNKSLRGQ